MSDKTRYIIHPDNALSLTYKTQHSKQPWSDINLRYRMQSHRMTMIMSKRNIAVVWPPKKEKSYLCLHWCWVIFLLKFNPGNHRTPVQKIVWRVANFSVKLFLDIPAGWDKRASNLHRFWYQVMMVRLIHVFLWIILVWFPLSRLRAYPENLRWVSKSMLFILKWAIWLVKKALE